MLLNDLRSIAHDLRCLLADFEADTLTTADAAAVLESATEVERLAGSLKLLAAARAIKSRRWADEGHRSAAGWLAQKAKSSFGDALSTVETARRLGELPRTTEALRKGHLSGSQAKEVAQAACVDPTSERELLLVAREGNMKKLKERARHVTARSASREDELSRYRAIHRSRYFRHWSESDGAFCLNARLTGDSGARLVASIQSEADSIVLALPDDAAHESPRAYRADALVALVTGSGTERSGRRSNGTRSDSLVVRVDASALRRGYVKDAETCEIPGVGPVPVATAEHMLGNAFLKILVRDGVDVATVCHTGRAVPAHVQSALEERDPRCVVPGYNVSTGLENHHWKQKYSDCSTTSLEGLARVCRWHHRQITYEHFELVGGPGRWRYVGPRQKRS
jgi:hypothetical protein